MNESAIEISIVIATVGRAKQLGKSLESFERLETGTPSFEIVVVLDGEDPASQEICEKERRFPLRVLKQEHAGPGPARNLGAQAARGK